MPAISVVVFMQGIRVSGATVQLNGNGIVRNAATNAGGAAIFSGLRPGLYVINAAKGPTYLGTGYLNVSKRSEVLHIRYPARPVRSTKGTVTVGMMLGRKRASTYRVNMKSGNNSYSKRSAFGGKAKFIYVEPGIYQIVGTTEFQAGETRSGSATIKVVPGGFHEVTINTNAPRATAPSRPAKALHKPHDLLKEIEELEREIQEKNARWHRLKDCSRIAQYGYGRRSKVPLYTGGPSSGEEGSRVGQWARDRDRRNQLDKLMEEIEELKLQRDACKDAVRYIYKYD